MIYNRMLTERSVQKSIQMLKIETLKPDIEAYAKKIK